VTRQKTTCIGTKSRTQRLQTNTLEKLHVSMVSLALGNKAGTPKARRIQN